MKKSIFAADTPRATGKSSGDTSTKPAAASRKTVAGRSSFVSRAGSKNSVAKNPEQMETKLELREMEELSDAIEEEDDDVEYEATLALLGRKIEETPAAKVIVSDEMMREALSEMKARKSINLGIPSRNSMVDGNRDQGSPTASSMTHSGAGDGNHVVEGASLDSSAAETGDDSSGCPLEKVFEFLQALMTKNYEKALDLAKEILEHEPDNETVKEYMSVLKEFVGKGKTGDSDSDFTTDESSEAENEYSEELSTSSETDSVSEEDESSGDSSDDSDGETDHDAGNLELGNINIAAGKVKKTLEEVGVSKGDGVHTISSADSSDVPKPTPTST
ncbi:Glutamate-rich protein 2 [Orchesella cincta]|uniref:Glutamate-rich protein 2 n=1 Tax=Orchesella cincta TaxID=48709 RepID=A0A1D2MKW5_ORCCI|nr:Glutamate-rich protein 2 [Orchesella cincta]